MQNFEKITSDILNFIKTNDYFLLSAHINADGDAYASMIATHLLLERLGKKSVMILSDAHKVKRYDYLKNFNNILHYSEDLDVAKYLNGNEIQSAIILDVPSYFRLGNVQKLLPSKNKVVKIDHHPLEDVMGDIEWVEEEASSTTAMVYALYELAQIDIDLEMAKALYSGILYDTGRFSYSNTTARDYEIAAKMLHHGVKPAEITNRVFFENSFEALRTIGCGLYSLQNHLDGKVNTIYLTNAELQGQNQSEIEELANYSVSIRGGEVGLFIREIEPGYHKISLRSKEKVDVNVVAKAFNGGGHSRAAGCRISGDKNKVISSILAEISKQL